MVEIGAPLIVCGDYDNAGRKDHFRRVNRFIRHGVDRLMEKTEKENFFIRTYEKPSAEKTHYGRVAHCMGSRVERQEKKSVQEPKDYKHITCFVSSGIVKGEGHLGGGTVTNIPDIGFNPDRNFTEHRVKRQNIAKISKKYDSIHYGIKKSLLHSRVRKTSFEKLWMKKEHEEAAADIKEYERRKLQRKQEEKKEKRRDYEAVRQYNPWGQPSAGAPKITNGRLCAQMCGSVLKKSDSDENYDVLGLPKIVRSDKADQPKNNSDQWKRKKVENLSDFEKTKIQKENERKKHYAKYLEKQKSEARQETLSAKKESAKFVPKDFIWGRTDVERTLSGRIVPRKRQLYQLDHGTVHKSYKTYFSIADKMLRFPDHRPIRGVIDCHSYRHWGGKPGTKALMRCMDDGKNAIPTTAVQSTSPSTSVCTGNTAQGGSGGIAEGCGQQQAAAAVVQTVPTQQPTTADAAVQYEVHGE